MIAISFTILDCSTDYLGRYGAAAKYYPTEIISIK
jgi:hypothetical protein